MQLNILGVGGSLSPDSLATSYKIWNVTRDSVKFLFNYINAYLINTYLTEGYESNKEVKQ